MKKNGALITELRMIVQLGRLSSLTVPVVEEAADALTASDQLVADLASALKGIVEDATFLHPADRHRLVSHDVLEAAREVLKRVEGL